MGTIRSCCSTDTANQESIDISRRKGKETDEEPLLSVEPELTSSFSKFTTPNITIKPEPLFADHIFHYPKYLKKRQELEHFVEETEEIEQISYDNNSWLVFSNNPKIFDECRMLFDIIIWRFPVIEAFAKVNSNYQDYIQEKLKITKDSKLTYTYEALTYVCFRLFIFIFIFIFVFVIVFVFVFVVFPFS